MCKSLVVVVNVYKMCILRDLCYVFIVLVLSMYSFFFLSKISFFFLSKILPLQRPLLCVHFIGTEYVFFFLFLSMSLFSWVFNVFVMGKSFVVQPTNQIIV